MSAEAMTQTRPPVPYTADAIKAAIAHEAANGPAHVRIKALGMMARISGIFEQAKQLAKLAARNLAQRAAESLDPETRDFYERCQVLEGVDLTDLSMFSSSRSSDSQSEEEEASQADDEPL